MSRYKKATKSERPKRINFVNVVWPHTVPLISINDRIYQDKINFGSIDPGIEDLGICFQSYTKDVSITTSYIDCWKMGEEITEETDIYKIVDQYLASVYELIIKCDFVLIEKQLSENYNSTIIMQHIITTVRIWCRDLPHLPYIIKVPPSLKGKMMGAPPHTTSKGLKIWSKNAAYEYSYYKNDRLAARVILDEINRGKGDDVADAVLMVAAIFKKYKLVDSIEVNFTTNNIISNLSHDMFDISINSEIKNNLDNKSNQTTIELVID